MKKGDKLLLSEKVMIIHSITEQIKKIYKIVHYPEPDIDSKNKINFELDLSNYAIKN